VSAQVHVCLCVLQAILDDIPLALGFLIKVACGPRVHRPCVIGPRIDLVVNDPELKCRRALTKVPSLRCEPILD
jgi:hypothetical protein